MAKQSHIIDELGHRYGKLTVMVLAAIPKTNKRSWLCLCDCGKTKIVRGAHLRAGSVKSCGCGYRFPKGVAAFLNTVSYIKKCSS